MNCLRCGREIQEERVFCAACLETMKAYPIKPGTAVQIPDRHHLEMDKPLPRLRVIPEEQVPQLRRTIRILIGTIIALSLVLSATAWLLVRSLDSTEYIPGDLGRNYTAME